METSGDYAFLKPSTKAAHNFKRLQQANMLVYALLGVLVILGIWNVLAVASLIRTDAATDLADIGSISSHISSRLIMWVALITLAVFVFKEWKWGERSFSAIYFLAPLFFLAMVPVMSAEVQPNEETMVVKFTLNHCEPGAIEGGEVVNSDLCTILDPEDTTVYLSASNPTDDDVEWRAPNSGDSFGNGWQVDARGRIRVYIMFAQDSLDQCESITMTTSVMPRERLGYQCIERDGKAWLVQPYETSSVEGGRLIVYQEVTP